MQWTDVSLCFTFKATTRSFLPGMSLLHYIHRMPGPVHDALTVQREKRGGSMIRVDVSPAVPCLHCLSAFNDQLSQTGLTLSTQQHHQHPLQRVWQLSLLKTACLRSGRPSDYSYHVRCADECSAISSPPSARLIASISLFQLCHSHLSTVLAS